MEINLNSEEISTILVNWAKQKYKTHNINAGFSVKGQEPYWRVSAVLEITMTSNELVEQNNEMVDTAVAKARERIRNSLAGFVPNTAPDDQPSFEPLANVGEILA